MKKLLVIIFSIFLVGGFFYLLQNFSGKTSIYQTAQAGDAYNVSGWAWSENIGWISFNNTSGGGLVNYGVNIDPLNGDFDGYAWSENIGWISFKPSGPYPASPNNSARLDINTNQITGWARALAYGGGWDGWIKLNPSGGGVHLNEGTNELEGWAWGGDVVGWISFNCKDTDSCSSKSDYKVVYNRSINRKPTVKNLRIEPNYCIPGSIKFNWQFNDDPEDKQSYYEIQIAKDNAFSDLFITASSSASSNNHLEYFPEFSYNTTYYARVRVEDSSGLSSEWENTQFKTPEYAYPYPKFTVQPKKPLTGETVNFIDQSICYISGSENSSCKEYKDSNPEMFTYKWIFNGGSPSYSNIIGDASTTYNRSGNNYNVTLEITDKSRNVSCKTDRLVNIRFLPAWKEIP